MGEIIDQFFSSLSETDSRFLLLDYDGTLAPFKKERNRAYPYKGVVERLDALIAAPATGVIIISGRAIADLKPILGLKRCPEIWGSHGWEHLDGDGVYHLRKGDPESLRRLAGAEKYITDNNLGEYLEKKPASLAIHFRGVNSDKVLEIREKIMHNWKDLTDDSRLLCSEFDGGLELRLPGFNKGDVVRNILASRPPGLKAAYLGDDLTDEDAFLALSESDLGVLVRENRRPTAARAWLRPPEELLAFLDRWISIEKSIRKS
ncbi:MAG: trehalose-phosphatase [Candidatus Zixiibacteriota bacterium]|nr:MAG: trehalose-phosphatase [candidate division Zixibacteria bacterium]